MFFLCNCSSKNRIVFLVHCIKMDFFPQLTDSCKNSFFVKTIHYIIVFTQLTDIFLQSKMVTLFCSLLYIFHNFALLQS